MAMVLQRLWREKYEGLVEGPIDLSAQHMEVLRRGGCIDHEDVCLPFCITAHVLDHQTLPFLLQTVSQMVSFISELQSRCIRNQCLNSSCTGLKLAGPF